MNDRADTPNGKSRRGFAAMDPEKQREIAKLGGSSLGPEQRTFFKDRLLAVRAGRKGGEAPHPPRKRRKNLLETSGPVTIC